MTLILIVILVALIFEYINGFHDTANSIATVVSTKVLSPRQAIILAASTNLLGAMWGTAVAKTIASGLVDTKFVTSEIIVCALLGAIVCGTCSRGGSACPPVRPMPWSAACAARVSPPPTTTGASSSGACPARNIGGKAKVFSGRSSSP
jgi:hypothetical protein